MKLLSVLTAFSWVVTGLTVGAGAASPSGLANPPPGTDSTVGFSHGNTFPAIALPFPMNVWAPYTQPLDDSFYYQYRQTTIRGLRQTHQPSPWIGDYGAFALMPVAGKLAVKEEDRASRFRHEEEIAQPSYYSVRLNTWKARAELTPTERGARFRFTFEQPGESYVVLDAFTGGSAVEIIPAENKVIGFTRYNHGGVPTNFANYFVIVFDQPFTAHGVWSPEGAQAGVTRLAGKQAGAFLRFDNVRRVECKVASSFVSAEQAQRNLGCEIGEATFDQVRSRAEARWDEALGRVRVEGGSEEQQRTFYTALYRSILFPHKFYEFDEKEHPVYFSPYDGKVHEGFLYTDEDTGQMPSWYVFSALGFYPVCPGDTNYVIGSPLFDRATLTFGTGKQFTVTARDNGPQRPYIHAATMNGTVFDKTFLNHDQIVKGGELVFEMTSAPDYRRAVSPESRPPATMPVSGEAGTR